MVSSNSKQTESPMCSDKTIEPGIFAKYLDEKTPRYATIDQIDGMYRQRLHRIFKRLQPNPRYVAPEDLIQETFLRVYLKQNTFTRGDTFNPWINTIVRNLSIDTYRRMRSRKDVLTFQGTLPELVTESYERQIINPESDVHDAVHNAIQRLNSEYAQIITMNKFDGTLLKDIAALVGITYGAARVRSHRAQRLLQQDGVLREFALGLQSNL